MTYEEEFIKRYEPLIATVANTLGKQYPMLDREDLYQQAWEYAWNNSEGLDKYEDRKVVNTVKRAMKGYCLAEKATALRVTDQWFYDRDLVSRLLALFVLRDWPTGESLDRVVFAEAPEPGTTWRPTAGRRAGGFDPELTGNTLAGLYDMSDAWPGLRQESKRVLYLRYTNLGLDWDDLGHLLDMKGDSARKKHTRALDSLVRLMNQVARERYDTSTMRWRGEGPEV